MSIQNGNRLVTKQDLADMYQGILPYLGGMPEILANKFNKGDMYSTDEKMIGQWIDGKPLYQRTLNLGTLSLSTSTTHEDIDVTTWNIETFIDCKGGGIVYKGSTFQGNVTFPQNYINDLGFKSSVKISTSRELLVIYKTVTASGTYTIQNTFITIRYTKTTDSPISIGSDTDYSTEEKIIGTWIDGKPIYQKTFTGLNVSCVYNSWVTIVSAPANINTLLFAFPLDTGNKVFPSIECRINSGNIQGENTMASTTRIVNALTIQYTKTTD